MLKIAPIMPSITNIHAVSPETLQGGTTQVILVSEIAAAIAIDNQELVSSREDSPRNVRKISQIGHDLILAVSGTCAATDGKGATTFALQDRAEVEAQRLTWGDSAVDTSRLALALRTQLKSIEQKLYQRGPDASLKPQVSVLLAGVNKRTKVFGARIQIPGEWLTRGPFHTIRFSDPTVEIFTVSPGKFAVVVETRRHSLEVQARKICAGRDPLILKYQKVWSLNQPGATAGEEALRGAASDLVQFAIDNDDQIAGPIDVKSVRVR